MNTLKNARSLLLAAAAVTAAAVIVAPVQAAVIQVSSNAENSPRYAVEDGGTVRITGTISGTVQGQRYILEETTATLLPRILLDGLPITSAMGNFYALDPVTVSVAPASAGLALPVNIAVDLSLDIGTASAVGVRPDLLISRDDNPYLNAWTMLTFRGTLSTGADAVPFPDATGTASAEAQAVPEPAALAVLGVGLLGLAVARRRTL